MSRFACHHKSNMPLPSVLMYNYQRIFLICITNYNTLLFASDIQYQLIIQVNLEFDTFIYSNIFNSKPEANKNNKQLLWPD